MCVVIQTNILFKIGIGVSITCRQYFRKADPERTENDPDIYVTDG